MRFFNMPSMCFVDLFFYRQTAGIVDPFCPFETVMPGWFLLPVVIVIVAAEDDEDDDAPSDALLIIVRRQ
jgi:hypothetical protein